ncbi:MAG: hypothetical protein IT303_10120 [Dehalococcoidia bacterium]|nr:hypothetical protein [Dehalococcoidia bacterium]
MNEQWPVGETRLFGLRKRVALPVLAAVVVVVAVVVAWAILSGAVGGIVAVVLVAVLGAIAFGAGFVPWFYRPSPRDPVREALRARRR